MLRLEIPINHIPVSVNTEGNYNKYVYHALKSLTPIRKNNHRLYLHRTMLNSEMNSVKTLILDLDETLIHADFDNNMENHDHIVNFEIKGESHSVGIFIRPGLFNFLEKVSENFEILVFTASVQEYANAVLNHLDPENRIFKYRFYRESCINVNDQLYIKDLRIFVNRKLENIIIVDNSIYSFANQLSNGVLINSYYNNKEDRELSNLLDYLVLYLKDADDIRIINEKVFNFSSIMDEFL